MTTTATIDETAESELDTATSYLTVSGMTIDLTEIAELRNEFPGASDEALALVVSERRETSEAYNVRMAEVRRRVRQELDSLLKQRCHDYVNLLCGRDQRRTLSAAETRDQAWAEIAAARIAYRALGGKSPSTHGEDLISDAQRAAAEPPVWVKAFKAGRVDEAAKILGFTV